VGLEVAGAPGGARAGGGTVGPGCATVGRFVAAANHPESVRGHRFALAGTLTGRLLDLQREASAPGPAALLRAEGEAARDAAFCGELADGRHVGAVLLAPLAAHGETLGVLAVSRAEGEPPLSASDEARLRVVADHASLALHKARLVEAAQEANDTKSAFLATVSHELRTPLTALTGYGELLADEIFGPLTAGQGELVERMRAVTHQLTSMIEEILTFSALEAGREVVRPVAVDVAEVVLGVRAVVEPLAEQKGLAFAVALPPAAPPLVTDPDKLRQILVNLCGNAVKFTAAGSVVLTVQADDARGPGAAGPAERAVRFAVADTGVGIAAHDLPRLFHAFSQLDMGLTRRYGGTGLGLYISQRLARLLGGRIEVTSAPGAGSTFTLTLPLAPPDAAAGAAPHGGGAAAARATLKS
jgi:signal transduction histidine kinase